MEMIYNLVAMVVTWKYKFIRIQNYTLEMGTFYCIYLFPNNIDYIIMRTINNPAPLKNIFNWRDILKKNKGETWKKMRKNSYGNPK